MRNNDAMNFIDNELLSRFSNAKLSPSQISDWIEALSGFDFNSSVRAIKELSSQSRTIPLIADFITVASKYQPKTNTTQTGIDYNRQRLKYIVCTKSRSSLSVGFFTPMHLIGGQIPSDEDFIKEYSKRYDADFEIVIATFRQMQERRKQAPVQSAAKRY